MGILKFFLLPPVLAAIWIVAWAWERMYSTPDIIVIPVVFELIAFGVAFAFTAAVYWLIVLPSSFLTYRATGSRLAGGLLVIAIPVAVTVADMTLVGYGSRDGTLRLFHLTQVICPSLFLAATGYFLLSRRLNRPLASNGEFVPWLPRRIVVAIEVGLAACLLAVFAFAALWNRPVPGRAIAFTAHDRAVKDRQLVATQVQVITSLLDKPGGLHGGVRYPPYVLLDNVRHWEQGAREQIAVFNAFLEAPFLPKRRRSSRGSRRATYVQPEVPPLLLEAVSMTRRASGERVDGNPATLYSDAIETLGRYRESLDPGEPGSYNRIRLSRWLESAADVLARHRQQSESDSESINYTLVPPRSNRRSPVIGAIAPLWNGNDALYSLYGTAWALSMYLEGAEIAFARDDEGAGDERTRDALPHMKRAQEALRRCQAERWMPVVLSVAGMRMLQDEIARVRPHAEEALVELRAARMSLSRR